MTMKQARAMRDGVLKGDSSIAKAWKELLEAGGSTDFEDGSGDPLTQEELEKSDERGAKTLLRLRAQQDMVF